MSRDGIPTRYAGHNFRSRLEAKWAALFDCLKWKWVYEPEDLDGYIPDFLVYIEPPMFFEIKPAASLADMLEHANKIDRASPRRPLVIVGDDPVTDGFVGLCREAGRDRWTPIAWHQLGRRTSELPDLWAQAQNLTQWRPVTPVAHKTVFRAGLQRQPSESAPRTPVGPHRAVAKRKPSEHRGSPGASHGKSAIELRLAQKHLPAELALIASLLRYPVLSALVAQEGVLGEFDNEELRTLAERVLQSQAAAHPPTFEDLYAGLSQEIIEALRKPLAALKDDSIEVVSQQVATVMDKLRQQSEERRKFWARRDSAPPVDDQAAERAQLERGQGGLLKNRLTHLRKRERNRRPGPDPEAPR